MKSKKDQALRLLWAIADRPWTDKGTAVGIAMTVGGLEGTPWLGRVVAEGSAETLEAEVRDRFPACWKSCGRLGLPSPFITGRKGF